MAIADFLVAGFSVIRRFAVRVFLLKMAGKRVVTSSLTVAVAPPLHHDVKILSWWWSDDSKIQARVAFVSWPESDGPAVRVSSLATNDNSTVAVVSESVSF